ncbi:adipocyte plasma membrane-associated protein Hemomucin-like isoform X2 [Phymastichus coffea]|uniref:adipocyte plasma membrane-associated protein Hemomucin-like isoform X2 n=1 Tax=Phymastichus coffea TaxID=108790 RepID=UPI00273C0BC3|nr:adipocyte plasma membrane-associated protein Hemomucin-like isoform X2 [Phymastichus coffea]
MGFLKSIGSFVIYFGTFLTVITFIPIILPDAKFEEYSLVLPKKLNGILAINERLNNPEVLFQEQVKGAEAFASFGGELYTGVYGGYVMKVTDNKLVPIVKFGKDCDGVWQEAKCGRPLGLKFDKKGTLYVCDAYYGIFKVDVKTGKYEKLVDNNTPIEGKVPLVFNSLDIASNGDIYWSDSSTEFDLQNGLFAMLTNPSGRLMRYNVAIKKNEVIVHDLGFANGVALSADEQFVIVLETSASRIIKYNIKGPKAEKQEVLIEGLPGFPDNVHSDNNKGFLVTLVVYADSENPQISQSLAPHPLIRRMAARFLAVLEAPFKCLQTYYPNYFAERVIHYIGHFESMMILIPKISTVLRISQDGKILDASYGTDGKTAGFSSGYIHNGYLWLGSPFAQYVARVPLNKAFPGLNEHGQKEKNSRSGKQPEVKNTLKVETPPKPSPGKESKPITSTESKPATGKGSAEAKPASAIASESAELKASKQNVNQQKIEQTSQKSSQNKKRSEK